MYAWNDYPNIVIELDDSENFFTGEDLGEEIISAVANSGSVDFLELVNEGCPVCLGNAYAVYEFLAYQQGVVYQYAVRPNESETLQVTGTVALQPFPYNDLDTIAEYLPWLHDSEN